jgi:hypothetical protein
VNSERPKRRWFQFHLSTLLILILLAGFLIPINIFAIRQLRVEAVGEARHGAQIPANTIDNYYYAGGLTGQCLVDIIIVGSIAFISEFAIRRRETARAAKLSTPTGPGD